MRMSFYLGLVLVCLTFIASAQAPPYFEFTDGVVFVRGLGQHPTLTEELTGDAWKEILSITTHDAFVKKINQPVAGKYKWTADGISFEPAFPFSNGEVYHAVFSTDAFAKNTGPPIHFKPGIVEWMIQIPREEFQFTFIKNIYPQSTVLPENLLRMYIAFSQPMMPGEAYDHIKLFDENGKQLEKPFLVIDQELWDSDRKRLTILFDPGRIKRGLKSNLELGTPLREGKKYHLVVDSTWRDAHGNYLQGSFKKNIIVNAAQRSRLDVDDLKLFAPTFASREPLTILFDRPIDHVLISKFITVEGPESASVTGHFNLIEDRILRFIPDSAWQAANYVIMISPLLEDVAGNNFNNTFDLDLSKNPRVNSDESLRVPFSIEPLDTDKTN